MPAGFYVHIPFCRQACRYCDFHFGVSLKYKSDMLKAMRAELKDKYELFAKEKFGTLYFGGGTPSVLNIEELEFLLDNIKSHFQFLPEAEISFEANPDDLTPEYLRGLKSAGIHRLSIGIQSFRKTDLELMRRSHTAEQAEEAVRNAKNAGFTDINADLIYGIPGLGTDDWKNNVCKLLDLEVQHISAYHLTYEPGTVFDHWRKKKRIIPVEEEDSLRQLKILKEETEKRGFQHYEISNFALPGFYSKHNTLYWKNQKYLGIGPSAHSYTGKKRIWNISSNKNYIEKLLKPESNYTEKEILSKKDQYNEYILTSLRTVWGIDLNEISTRFGDNYVKYTREIAKKHLDKNILSKSGDRMSIFNNGIFLCDRIIRDFIKV